MNAPAVTAPEVSLRSNSAAGKRLFDGVFRVVLYAALGIALAALAALLWRTWEEGQGAVGWHLIEKQPSERPARAGIQLSLIHISEPTRPY